MRPSGENSIRSCSRSSVSPKPASRLRKFYHTVYSGQELKDRMAQIGFTDVKLFGNHNGDEYGANAQCLIVVGHKPDEQKANKH